MHLSEEIAGFGYRVEHRWFLFGDGPDPASTGAERRQQAASLIMLTEKLESKVVKGPCSPSFQGSMAKKQ